MGTVISISPKGMRAFYVIEILGSIRVPERKLGSLSGIRTVHVDDFAIGVLFGAAMLLIIMESNYFSLGGDYGLSGAGYCSFLINYGPHLFMHRQLRVYNLLNLCGIKRSKAESVKMTLIENPWETGSGRNSVRWGLLYSPY